MRPKGGKFKGGPLARSRIDPERARIDTLWFNHRWVIGGIIVGLAIVIRALTPAT